MMSNRFWVIASGIVWFLGMGLAVVIFFQYDGLRSELADTKIQIAKNETELQKKQAELGGLQEKIARQQSQFAMLEDAVIEVTQFLAQNSGKKDLVQNLCSRNGPRMEGLALTICANVHNVLGNSYYEYLQTVLQATLLRSSEKFESANEKYEIVQSQLENVEAPPGHLALLKALALEGQAYSSYRQNHLEAARGLIEEARKVLEPFPKQISGFVALTDLKIACEMKKSESEVSEEYKQYSRSLANAASSASGSWIDYRKRDLDNFNNDPELDLVCPKLKTEV